MGLSANSYGNYELLRAPVRYDLAYRLFSRFNLNPMWLATGEGFDDVHVSVPAAQVLKVSPRDLFSEVYDKHLHEFVPALIEQALSKPIVDSHSFWLPRSMPITAKVRAGLEMRLFAIVERLLDGVPDAKYVECLNVLLSLANDVLEHFPDDPPEVVAKRQAQMRAARKAQER